MAYTPRGFPTPVISPVGAGTVSVVKTYEEFDDRGWFNEWTVTATANSGFRFVKFEWVKWDDDQGEISGESGTPFYADQGGVDWGGSIGYKEDYYTRIEAVFEEIQPPTTKYHVTTISNPESGGTTTGDGDYAQGDTVTIIATAKPGYRFVKWVSDTGGSISDNPVVFQMLPKDYLWVAYFAKCTGLILRDSESGKILRSTSNGKILRDN